MLYRLATALLVVPALCSATLERRASTPVTLPSSAPSTAQPLSQNLFGLSIEQDRWPDWAGTSARNDFTFNALSNLGALTGAPTKIRVGADSEDRATWAPSPTLIEDATFPAPNAVTPYPEASNATVGDAFYALVNWLPKGTRMTWGVNLKAHNATNAVNIAKAIARAFGQAATRQAGVLLDFIEIGNEPDFYESDAAAYITDWTAEANPVASAIGMKAGTKPAFQAGAFGGTSITAQQILSGGIRNSAAGKLITQISQHRYSGAFCSGGGVALASFMSKAAVRSNLTLFESDIAATHAQGLSYVLGETNSIACHGAPGVSNTAGAALWMVDYVLQAASLGISEAFFHEGVGYKYNLIQPVPLNRSTLDGSPLNPPQPALVQPPYYAAILANTAIGPSGTTSLVELSVPLPNVSGYAIFEKGALARAVFVNLDAWLASDTGARPSVTLALQGKSGTAKVLRLAIGHADDTKGLTFAGQNYEASGDATVSGTRSVQSVDLSAGIVLSSSEAVVVEF